jgi:hypothetical protein
MTKRSRMKSLLSKIGKTTDSKTKTEINPKDQGNEAIDTTLETETTGTGIGSTASTAKSRTTLRKNARSELNHAKTNKEAPIGLKCT